MQKRDQYRRDLFEDFLPFMDRYVVDHEHGGFMCAVDRDGTRISDDKDSWYEGRGIWVYSFLYRHLTHDPRHLEIARKAVDLVLGIRPGHDARWPRKFTRCGETLVLDGEIYGSLFIAEGLAEYSAAASRPEYWDLAKDILNGCLAVYECPDYPADPRPYLGVETGLLPGARVQGVAMVLLRLASQMLAMRPDVEIQGVADRALKALLEQHYNPAFHLNNEFLQHDYSLPTDEYAQFVYTGHALEAMWMAMDEALRRGDSELFDLAARRFRRHVEVCWDGVYGGVFRGLRHVDRNDWLLDKVLWEQEEVLIGCLMLMEHREDAWAAGMFDKMYRYVHEKYPLKRWGLPLWISAADRKVTFEPHYNRIENYHHPRHLMLNLLALERMGS